MLQCEQDSWIGMLTYNHSIAPVRLNCAQKEQKQNKRSGGVACRVVITHRDQISFSPTRCSHVCVPQNRECQMNFPHQPQTFGCCQDRMSWAIAWGQVILFTLKEKRPDEGSWPTNVRKQRVSCFLTSKPRSCGQVFANSSDRGFPRYLYLVDVQERGR